MMRRSGECCTKILTGSGGAGGRLSSGVWWPNLFGDENRRQLHRLGKRVKKKTGRSGPFERFADGSSLETPADGSVVLCEGGLAKAAAVGSGVGSGAASPARVISYADPPPLRPKVGG